MSELTDPPFDTREPSMHADQPVDTKEPSMPTPFANYVRPRHRKHRRVGPDGKPIRRLVLACTATDYGNVMTAISTRSSPLFSKVFGDPSSPTTGELDEMHGAAIAMICADWLSNIGHPCDE